MLKTGKGKPYKIRLGEDFKKGLKRMKKRKKPMSDLRKIINILASGKNIPGEYDPHPLTGDLYGYWACQVGKNADWRLVYRIDKENKIVMLANTGTHEEVYKRR
jgi:mRNA interferase YafQ